MEMVRWANEKVKSGGKSSTMKSFKDSSLSNAVFFLDLLNAIKPGYVDYALVTQGRNDEEKRSNGQSRRGAMLRYYGPVADNDFLRHSQAGHFDREEVERPDLLGSRGLVHSQRVSEFLADHATVS